MVWFGSQTLPSGRGEKGEKKEGSGDKLDLNSDPRNFITVLIIDSCKATNTYKFIAHTLNMKPHVHTTHSHEIFFTTHTYLTFTFSLINADGRNAAVDLRVG